MKIKRQFTTAGKCAYQDINFTSTSSEIKNPDGSIVFQLDNVEVPTNWSQVASDVIAQKYFRKAGVPTKTEKVKEKNERGSLMLHQFIINYMRNTHMQERTEDQQAASYDV